MTEIMIGFVGDVLVNRDRPDEIFGAVRDVLGETDILFANLEGAYTDNPKPVPSAPSLVSAPSHNLDCFAAAGFNVMCLANNHILDVGYDAMLENRARLQAQGVATCGAGDTLIDARAPALVEIDGVTVAFLAYASVFPVGYDARDDRPGLVPLRAYNVWRDSNPNIYTPGTRPLAATIADEADMGALASDIAKARDVADIVIASFHWGDYWRPLHLTDHEFRTARFCVDRGADMVIGHHHHALRGMEWYRGKPIMYGLGHFVFDSRVQWSAEEFRAKISEADPGGYSDESDYAPGPREGWPLLPMHEDTRKTVLAWARVSKDGLRDCGVLPCRLSPDGLVHPLQPDSPDGADVMAFLDKCNRSQRLETRFTGEDAPTLAGFRTRRMVPYIAAKE